MSNLIGPLLLLYAIGATFMAAACQYVESSRRDKIQWGLRLYFIFGWPTFPLFFVYMALWGRYEKWQLKRQVRRLGRNLTGKISQACKDDSLVQRAMDNVNKAIDDL